MPKIIFKIHQLKFITELLANIHELVAPFLAGQKLATLPSRVNQLEGHLGLRYAQLSRRSQTELKKIINNEVAKITGKHKSRPTLE